jgi:hypothetical protein
MQTVIKTLVQKISDKTNPYYESFKIANSCFVYRLRYLPLNEEFCTVGQFYNLLGEAVGNHCMNGKLFFYDQNGELSATIDWKHTWRDA